ncbi:MAG: Gfo/Idh/MocA family oxidoreductase [Planctomycetota bacterium]|nr:Gfo/Idh/MocA family oxidoreductase [Planctomycetota bacterium]
MSINIGILGFAHAHVGMYCREWKQKPELGINIAAGWDHDAARLANNAKEFSLAAHATPAALLADKAIQAVVIAAETSMHADLVAQAAKAGKTIVLQKPLCLTLAEADAIVAAVEKAKVPFTLAWQMRVDPQNLEMKRLVADGTLGRLYMVRRRHTLSTHLWAGFDESWHVKPELNRGMWADDAAHAIDFLYWLLGMPQSVMAEIDTLRNPKVPDDHGIAIFRYADGLFAEVVGSFCVNAGENTTEITAEKGYLTQSFGDGTSAGSPRPADAVGLKWLIQGDKDWTRSPIPSPPNQGPRIGGLAAPLAAFMNGKGPALASVKEGRDVLQMTLATYESAKLGKRVAVRDVK